MKPVIGVTPDFHPGHQRDRTQREPTYFLRARYLKALLHAGGLPLVLPFFTGASTVRRIMNMLHGLVITGSGSDLSPEFYGERQRFRFPCMSRERATLELTLAKYAYRMNMPTLGICGGMQTLNVALGGTLIQDIPSELSSSVNHKPIRSATSTAHVIHIRSQSQLARILGRESLRVNSSHHQSVKQVASVLVATATAPDGVIEALEAPSRTFIVGVQWHPEYLYDRDPAQQRLFRTFIKAAQAFQASRRTSFTHRVT
ncbi:MAG: gamma-glutamyl-gamma-aminobutyrate hydrolase family protein [Nitrospirae bacterium]|nr:MAG: gamma-glutamyl-gamma-aminobutyrate hydrolase family protein [Nitrospirota bacterium]